MRPILAFLLTIIMCVPALAQVPTGTVSIHVIDDKQKPIDGATVSLLNAKDSSLIKINITDKDGAVAFENIKYGRYMLSVSNVGFKKAKSDAIVLDENHQQASLNSIILKADASVLSEVTIQEKKPFIERQLDRVVVNVSSSIASAGSTALDILSRAPGVLVNQNDQISMKGKQGVMVMIDGKPTYLSATDLANLLRSTPANAIDKIELITNPSAKYDAAGSSGIINIKLKKDQRYGTNGSLALNRGQGVYAKANAGLNLNYRNKNVNIFGNYNYTYRESFNHLVLYREFFTNGQVNGAYDQNNYLKFPVQSHLAKAGADFFASPKTTIGVVFTGITTGLNTTGQNMSVVQNAQQQNESYFSTGSHNNNRVKNFATNINFKHTADTSGRELTSDFDYAHYGSNVVQNYDTQYFNLDNTPQKPADVLKDYQLGQLDIYSIKADYVLPLKHQQKFETGIKASFVRADNDLAFYNIISNAAQFDSTKSNHFIYDENISAAYINYNKNFKRFKVQLGLRGEQTIARGNQVITQTKFKSSYVQLFPSMFISDKLSEDNELNLSISRRIDRPTYKQLNPFKFYLDPSTYVEGNPYLKPQLTYQAQLSYTYKQKYNITATYSKTDDNITSILIPNQTLNRVTIQTDLNLAKYYYYGLSFSAPFEPAKWWSTNNNINFYYNNYSGNLASTPLNSGLVAFDANSSSSITINKKTSAEINAVYTSRNVYGYLGIKQVVELSMGIQRLILNNKGTLKLNVTDALYSNKLIGTTTIDNYSETFRRNIESRVATLAFTYRFGSNKVAPSRKRSGGAEEEKKRAA